MNKAGFFARWAHKASALSITHKLLLMFLVLALLPLIVTNSNNVRSSRRQLRAQIEQELLTVAEVKRATLNDHLRTNIQDAQGLAQNRSLIDFLQLIQESEADLDLADESSYHQSYGLLRDYQETHWGAFHHVFLTDPQGQIILSPPHKDAAQAHEGQSIIDSPFFQPALNSTQITDFFGFTEKDHYHQLLLEPVVDSDGQALGVLVFEIDIDHVKQLLESHIDVARTMKVFLATLDGFEVVKAKVEGEDRTALESPGLITALQEERAAGEYVNHEGRSVYGIYLRDTTYPWVLGLEVDKSEIMAPIREATRDVILFTMIFVVLLLGLGFLSGRGMAKSLVDMAEVAHKVSDGDLEQRIEVTSKDERGELGVAFNKLLDKARKSIRDFDAFINLVMSTNETDDIDHVFQRFLEVAKEVSGASFAALGVFNSTGELDSFLTLGVPEDIKHHFDGLPDGKGLLGHIHQTGEVLRLDDLSEHPASVGFPAEHLPMKSLLAVPIRYRDQVLGNLYLADKRDENAFDEDDERIIVNIAKVVGAIVYVKTTTRERERVHQLLQAETNQLVRVIDRLSSGDFTVDIDATDRGDSISRVKIKLREMVSSLNVLLVQLRNAIGYTASAAGEITHHTEQLASGVHEQSAQAQEVAAAVEEMAQTIVENANNATHTADAASNSGQAAEQGGRVVQQTVEKIRRIADVVGESAETVERLGQSSAEIGEIIAVIDEIADQTNLLALNAAIEAARAGEQGRGFAVVADEVRKLAERTTQATKQIATMIKTIQTETEQAVVAMQHGREEVAHGIRLADEAGSALERIVNESHSVVGMITQIAQASKEQSVTSEEISRSVEAISTVSNASAEGISEIASSGESLSEVTDELRSLVARFRLSGTDQGVTGSVPTVTESPSFSLSGDGY
ncbi:MAG: methyl-accepting chemotaxis protein [Rhodothermales bacterium]